MKEIRFFAILPLLLLASPGFAQHRPPANFRPDLSQSMLQLIDHLLKNDDLQCLPRLLCEYAAGSKPGQTRAINIDINSLFTMLQYLGLDQNALSGNPMFSFGQAALVGMSHRGDSYECYKNYPRCPRDETRLLHYLNNHRGGFFRGFRGFSQTYSRIVNKKLYSDNFGFATGDRYNSLNNLVNYADRDPKFVFSNASRRPKGLPVAEPTDRLPIRFNSQSFEANSIPGPSFHQFFPQY